ncbi:MAG: sigma-70 family RNA polymerase sigma factor [Acidobacteria bacterium]|nr:sigma-70 family RNA polymerase sigma factor [Acidobacteriota bacterium]
MAADTHAPGDEELRLFFRLLERAGRRGGLTPDDLMDFTQSVHLRLLETDYALFGRFEHQSSLKTYLSVVADRLLKDWKNHVWGKWRPSAAASRRGPAAVALERLIVRDGLSADEAIGTLAMRPGAPPVRELRQLLDQLARRPAKRRVSDEILADMPAASDEDPLVAQQHARVQALRWRAVQELLARLPEPDRQLLEVRYLQDRRVPDIAHLLGEPPKVLYRRCDRLLRSLRQHLEAQGLGPGSPISGARGTVNGFSRAV